MLSEGKECDVDQRRLRVLLAMAVGAVLIGIALLAMLGQRQRVEKADTQVEELRVLGEFNDRLIKLHEATNETLGVAASAVGKAVQDKEKINRAEAKALHEIVSLFKSGIASARTKIDALEKEARTKLTGQRRQEFLTGLTGSRKHLDRLQGAQEQFQADVEKAFGPPPKNEVGEDSIRQEIKDALRKVQEADKRLNEERNR